MQLTSRSWCGGWLVHIGGKTVYLLKDVVSTGVIETYLISQLKQGNPKTLKLVARDVSGYIELACTLAADRERCASLRRYLEGAGRLSPLFDADARARALERAFDAMIDQHRSGRRAPITVDANA